MDSEQVIKLLSEYQTNCYVRTHAGTVEPATPTVLTANLLPIRGLLLQLVEHVSAAELDYRRSKAKKYDELVKEGQSRSAARDQLDMDVSLVEKKIAAERLRNFMKYSDGLCTSIQTTLKVMSSGEKNSY